MYARIVSGSIAPAKLDKAIGLWQETVAPSVEQQKGFISARLLVQRKSGRVVSIGLWDSEADLENTVEWNKEQITRFASFFTVKPTVEHYEVVAEV